MEAVLSVIGSQKRLNQAQQGSEYIPDDAAKKMKAAEQLMRNCNLDDVPVQMKKNVQEAVGSKAAPKAEVKAKAQPKNTPKVGKSGDGYQWEFNVEDVAAQSVVISAPNVDRCRIR